jgi:hypothetical protein
MGAWLMLIGEGSIESNWLLKEVIHIRATVTRPQCYARAHSMRNLNISTGPHSALRSNWREQAIARFDPEPGSPVK